MENRRSQRIPVMIKLLLFKNGLPVAIGRTRNVSSGGLFVQTDYVDLGSNGTVEMELLSNRWTRVAGRSKHRGFITHLGSDGFGVRFEDPDKAERGALAIAIQRSLRCASIE
jgi:hypothetical protein